MRTIMAGALEGSHRALEALAAAGETPDLVVTLDESASARHAGVHDLGRPAEDLGVRVLRVQDINAEASVAAMEAVDPDLLLVIGWPQVCRRRALDVPRIGALGFHPALLPKMRGRTVIPWTILTGQVETGSTLYWLDQRTDAGDILDQRRMAVAEDETARSLCDKHLDALCEMLPEAIRRVRDGVAERRPQDHARASWCARRRPEDGVIDWTRPAAEVERLVRAVGEPWPGAFTTVAGHILHIDKARIFPHPERYIGLPGQIQHVGEVSFIVRCGDGGCLEVTAWRHPSGWFPERHEQLGLPIVQWSAA